MVPYGSGILSFAILPPVVLEVSKKLFFLAIDRNHGQIFSKIRLSRCFDKSKLCIPVRVRFAYLEQLLILLLAIAEIADQTANSDVAGLEALSFNDRLNVSQT